MNIFRKIIDGIYLHLYRKPMYRVEDFFSTMDMPEPSDEEIDIVIPVIEKDLLTLPFCLEGVRRNIANKIKNIYLVAPDKETIKQFASESNVKFVDEKSVLGITAKDINYITTDGKNRSGWLFQQFLKLAGNIGTCKHFITIDADHILIRPHVFLTKDNKYVFYQSSEYNSPYYRINKKLIGITRVPVLSYVAHKMIFNRDILSDLQSTIEKRCGKDWISAIIENLDRNYASAFSEFEIYAAMVASNRKIKKTWKEKQLYSDAEKRSIEKLREEYPHNLSVTYPDYYRRKK